MTDAVVKNRGNDSAEVAGNFDAVLAGLFSPDADAREAAIANVVPQGENLVGCLALIAQRPLGCALDCWPEWQQMLPAQAIMARCGFAQSAALQAMSEIGTPAIEELTRLLDSPDTHLREGAADALRRMDAPEAIDALRHSLERELGQRKRLRRTMNGKRGLAGVGAAMLLLPVLLGCHLLPIYAGCAAVLGGLLVWLLLRFADGSVGVRRKAVAALAQTDDCRNIGLLTACLEDPDDEVRQSVGRALTQLLPHARIQDWEHITRKERALLLRALDGDNPDLAVAVLNALQHLADAQILRRVAYLIDSPVHHRQVREAAHECLPQVKQRLKAAQDAQDLLRGAHEHAIVSAHLLRPLREQTTDAPEEQLLHPHMQ